jgi:hypothetical protein
LARAQLALAKRVTFEVLHPLVRTGDLGPAAATVARVLARASVYEAIPHPRYRFTQDWFTANVPTWERVLAPIAGKPELQALEIGSFEGQSACWLLDHVLTHPTSRLVCVDPFDGAGQPHAEHYFDDNVRRSGSAYKVLKLKGLSRQAVPLLAGHALDLAYVDGSHDPADALADGLLVWPLLRRGALVIFDDYGIGASYPDAIAAGVDPRPGIDAFLGFMAGRYEVVERGYQLIVRKER